jgi:hypothetical protein
MHIGFNPFGGVGVGVGAGDLIGVGETVSSVGTSDGETVGEGEGESEGMTVECFVGTTVADGSTEGKEVTRVGRNGVEVGSAAQPERVGVGYMPRVSI